MGYQVGKKYVGVYISADKSQVFLDLEQCISWEHEVYLRCTPLTSPPSSRYFINITLEDIYMIKKPRDNRILGKTYAQYTRTVYNEKGLHHYKSSDIWHVHCPLRAGWSCRWAAIRHVCIPKLKCWRFAFLPSRYDGKANFVDRMSTLNIFVVVNCFHVGWMVSCTWPSCLPYFDGIPTSIGGRFSARMDPGMASSLQRLFVPWLPFFHQPLHHPPPSSSLSACFSPSRSPSNPALYPLIPTALVWLRHNLGLARFAGCQWPRPTHPFHFKILLHPQRRNYGPDSGPHKWQTPT